MSDCITARSSAKLEGVIRVDDSEIRSHVDEVVSRPSEFLTTRVPSDR